VGGLSLVLLVLVAATLVRSLGDPAALLRLRSEAHPALLAVALVPLFGGIVFMAFRWRELLPGRERIPPWGLVGICAAGQLLNVALPGPVGELIAAAMVKRRYAIPGTVAFAAAIHSRFVGITTAALVSVVIWLLVPLPMNRDAHRLMMWAVAFVIAASAGLGLFAARPGLFTWMSEHTLGRVSRWRLGFLARWCGRGHEVVVQFTRAMSDLGRSFGWPHLRAAGWAVVGLVSVTLGTVVAARALGHPADPTALLFAHASLTAGAIVLFALPVGQLGWDAGFATLLVAVVGLPLEHALAITILVRLAQFLIMLGGAGVLLGEVRRLGAPERDAEPAKSGYCP
jgi:hypothetical protein